MTQKVLDAWAVMAWLEGEVPARTRVSALFDSASERRIRLLISMINVGEIFYLITKRRSAQAAEEFLTDFAAFPVTVLNPGRRQISRSSQAKGAVSCFLRRRVRHAGNSGSRRHSGYRRQRNSRGIGARRPSAGLDRSPTEDRTLRREELSTSEPSDRPYRSTRECRPSCSARS